MVYVGVVLFGGCGPGGWILLVECGHVIIWVWSCQVWWVWSYAVCSCNGVEACCICREDKEDRKLKKMDSQTYFKEHRKRSQH